MRLIDAEAFEEKVQKLYCSNCGTKLVRNCHDADCWIDYARRTLETLPTIEAKPVVHAHWEEKHSLHHVCSNCRNDARYKMWGYDVSEDLSDFCPHCGAQMDEVAEDD